MKTPNKTDLSPSAIKQLIAQSLSPRASAFWDGLDSSTRNECVIEAQRNGISHGVLLVEQLAKPESILFIEEHGTGAAKLMQVLSKERYRDVDVDQDFTNGETIWTFLDGSSIRISGVFTRAFSPDGLMIFSE